jgi:EAL domain-containing protein (putative c-di-GMP-specific phosphodiesterase class I)
MKTRSAQIVKSLVALKQGYAAGMYSRGRETREELEALISLGCFLFRVITLRGLCVIRI